MGDFTSLLALITAAQSFAETDYTEASWAQFNRFFRGAEEVVNLDPQETVQYVIDEAERKLQAGIDQLLLKVDGCEFPMDAPFGAAYSIMGFTPRENPTLRRMVSSPVIGSNRVGMMSVCETALSLEDDWQTMVRLTKLSKADPSPGTNVTVGILEACTNVPLLSLSMSWNGASWVSGGTVLYNNHSFDDLSIRSEVQAGQTKSTLSITDWETQAFGTPELVHENARSARLFAAVTRSYGDMSTFVIDFDIANHPAVAVPLCGAQYVPDEDFVIPPQMPDKDARQIAAVEGILEEYEANMGLPNPVNPHKGIAFHLTLVTAFQIALDHDVRTQTTVAMDKIYAAFSVDARGAFSQTATSRFGCLFSNLYPEKFNLFRPFLSTLFETLEPGGLQAWLDDNTEDSICEVLGRSIGERYWWWLTRI